jgi:hypothetical protein
MNFKLYISVFISLLSGLAIAQDDGALFCCQGKMSRHINTLEARGTQNQDEFDVLYYNIDLEIFPLEKTVSGEVKIRSRALNDINTLELDLATSLFVTSVKSGNTNLSFDHRNDLLSVNLNRTYDQDEIIEIIVKYSGKPGNTFSFSERDGHPWIWTLSQPYGAKDWWPCKNLPDDKADSVDLVITVPEGLIVASNGLLMSEETINGKTTWHWHEKYPICSYLVSLAIYPYMISTDYFKYSENDSMPVVNYIMPNVFENNRKLYQVTIEMLEYFTEIFGPYPFIEEKYGHAEFPWGGGMEHQTISSMIGPFEFLIAHELAHQWWGDMITCSDFHHIWLNEGFATYSEALWDEYKNGPAAMHNRMRNRMYFGKGSIYVDNVENIGRIFDRNLSYNKPSWVLHMLRNIMGDEMFFNTLRAWGESDKKYGVAVTEDFQEFCEEVSQMDLSDFFQQWIYGEYHPVYLYDWDYSGTEGHYELNLEMYQFQIENQFTMPVDIHITTELGDTVIRVNNYEKFHSYAFKLDGKPLSVTPDKDNWILKRQNRGINMVNHDNNNIVLSIGADGAIGYDKPDGFGNGMIYPSKAGANLLYFGTFMAGNSENYVADNPAHPGNKDFIPEGKISIETNKVADLDIEVTYSDSGHPDSRDLKIKQTSYSWGKEPLRDMVFVKYVLENEGSEAIENLHAGVFMDFDIGKHQEDQISRSEEHRIIYQYNAGTYAGIKKLSHNGQNTYLSGIEYAIDNLKENAKYGYLSGLKNDFATNKKSDWSSMVSSGPHHIARGDSLVFYFVMLGAKTQQEIISRGQIAQNYFDQYLVSSYNEDLNPEKTITIYPNPATTNVSLDIGVHISDKILLEIFDLSGKEIFRKEKRIDGNQIDLNISGIPSGIYTIKMSFSGMSETRKLVIAPI